MLSQCVQSFSSHCWGAFSCVFDACVWGGWTKAMCLVRPHTSGASLYKSCENQTIKCTKCALWVTDLPHLHHRHLAYLSKSLVTAPVSLGLCEINFQKNKIKKSVWLLTTACEAQAQPLTSLSTNGEFHHADLLNIRNDCLQSMCTVKKTIFIGILYFAPLSFYSCADLPL